MRPRPRPTLDLNGKWTQQRQQGSPGKVFRTAIIISSWCQRSLLKILGPWFRANPDLRILHHIDKSEFHSIRCLMDKICCDKLLNVFRKTPYLERLHVQMANGTVKFPYHSKFFSLMCIITATLQENMKDPFGVGASLDE